MHANRRTRTGWLAALAAALVTAVVVPGAARAQTGPLEDHEIEAVTGLDHQLWVRGAIDDQWRPLGGQLIDAPAVVRGAFNVYFVGLGTDHNVWIRTLDAGWRPFGPDGTYCTGPGATAGSDTFAVACRGRDGAAWIATTLLPLDDTTVPTARGPESVGWRSLGGVIKYGAEVTGYQPDPGQQPTLAVVAVGADDRPWYNTPDAGWRRFSTQSCGGPVATSLSFEVLACRSADGQLKAFHTAFGTSATLLGGRIKGRPGVAVFAGGRVDYFALGLDDRVWSTRQRADGGQDPWVQLPGAGFYGISAVAPRA